ncbi:MAG: SprB repeat-containing protein, partial [Saprospiraceae bacterium]|nr:SprB repeat-containing protein [Saprospiraceae bacterium]
MRLEINIGLCFFMGFILTSGWSQTSFYNNNVKVALKGGVTLYIDGDLKHNSNSSNGQFVVLDNGIIKLTGDLINEGSTNLFKSGDLSTVQFSQAGNKSITGNGSGEINFNKVVISDASLITLRRDISFLSDFTFQSGNVFLNGFAAELRLRNGNIFGAGDIEPKIMEEDANNRFYGTSGYLQLSGPVNTGLTTLYTFGNLGAGIRQPGLTQIGLRRGHTSQSIRSSMSIQRYYDMTTPAPIFGNGELEFNYLEGPQSDLAGTGNEADLALFRHRINALGSLDPGVIWRYISEATTNPSANQTSMQNLDSLLTFRWTLQECQRPSVTINASATKACTGSDVTLDAGPSPGWSYLWSTGERTQSIDVSSANSALETYFVIVTNGEGCNNSDTVEITWVEQPTIVFDPSSAAVCAGDSLVIDPVVTGSDLTYSWSSGEDTRSIVHYSDGLGAATYSLTVTASALCDAEESITIDDLSGPPLDLGPDQNICDASTYTIDAGLGSGYSYSWSNGSNQSSITVGISGSYHLRVTDQNTGCRAYDTIDIQFGSLTINVNSQDVSCFGKADGAIQISVVQGTFPFSYIWSDGSTDNQLLGVDAGLYSVTVTDALGCIDSLTDIEVLAPDSLSITPEVTVDFCGLSEGQIILNPSGGSLPYRFEWYDADNNFISSNQDIQGLTKGGYTIHIRDDHDCVYESDVYVSGPDAMLEIEAKIENASCNMNDGSIELLISGGTSPYAIDWITGGSTSEILTGLTSGFYQVMVTDANDCSVTRTFEVEDTINPQLLVDSLKHVSCFGYDDGAVYLSLEGLEGTTPDILWSNGALTQDLTGLEPGIYKVTITVEGACSTLEETFEIEEPAELKNDLVIDSIFCFGQGGDIVTNVTGGVPNYSFQWSTGNHTNHLTNLNPGQYSLTVTDQNGCEIRDTVDLSGPALLEVHLHANEPICPGTQDGEIILDIDGGTGRYRIEWDHGDIGSSPENLSAGIYTVHITDDNGCRIDTAFEVVEWEPIQTQQTIVTPSADGAGDGAIHLEISGGKAPYSFQWSNDSTSQNISGLTEGIYTVLITDARGCQQQFTYEVLDPQSFNVGLATNAISCPGGNDGSMEIIILNGLAPYTILWSDGSTDEKLDHLSAGTYAVTVTDGEGTMRTRSASLLDPVPLEVKASVTDVSFCDPGSGGTIVLSVTGGTRPYSYLWHDGDTTASRNNLLAGLYEVSVMDSLGCIITTTYEIHNVSIAIEDSIIYPSSPEAQDGEIYLQVLSGQGPFQFEWSNGGFSDHIEGLGTGRYEVTITDAVGCSLVDSFDLSATEPLQYMAVIDSLSCHGASNGAISLHLQGGVAPYSVAWAHGPVSETIDS